IQYAEALQPVARRSVEDAGVFPVVFAGRRLLRGGFMVNQPRGAVFVRDELPVAGGRAEQRAAKRPRELLAQPASAFAGRKVFGLVTRGMTQRERKIRFSL